MYPIHLTCDHATNPLVIETERPLLRWQLAAEPDTFAQQQTAYEIGVASTPELLDQDQFDLWTSGRVESDQMSALYAGRPLDDAASAFWKARVWDQHRQPSRWSAPATWTAGLKRWTAQWIGTDLPFGKQHLLPVFRKSIEIAKPVLRAVLFITGLGQCHATLDGRPISDHFLEPAWSDYDKTVYYVAHDLTADLTPGSHTLDVLIGHGMYNVLGGRYTKFKRSFGPHRLLAELHLTDEDGETQIIPTDLTWQVAASTTTFACIYGGEDCDAMRTAEGWRNAVRVDPPKGRLVAQDSPPVRPQRRYDPVRVTPLPDNTQLVDFGQNMAGQFALSIKGERGAKVTIKPAELLNQHGRITQQHTGSPVSYSYTVHGGGKEEHWQPRFAYTGFRYAEMRIEGNARARLAADFVHADAPVVGRFDSSDEHLNRIHTLINKAIQSNLQHVLTDCPHREKLGWIEQLHLMQPSVMWNYDLSRYLHKVCRDMRDAQHENGMIPTICPQYTQFQPPWDIFNDSPEWGAAAVITPWQGYQRYGDARLLEDNYEMMRRYADYLTSRAKDHIVAYGLGDWFDIGPGEPGFAKLTSLATTGTAMYFRVSQVVSRAAAALGKPSDADRYAELADRIREAFNGRLFDPQTLRVDTGSQCASAMALALKLVPPQHKAEVLKQLIDDVRQRDNHITAGDIGFNYVVQALSEAGRNDVMLDLLRNPTPPSYGSQLAAGATTLTEAWDANPRVSQNHLMLGHAEAWFWESLGGLSIDLTQTPAITLRPHLPHDIARVDVEHDGVLGTIAVRVERIGRRVHHRITLPPNTSAVVELQMLSNQRLLSLPIAANKRPIDFASTEVGRLRGIAFSGVSVFEIVAD